MDWHQIWEIISAPDNVPIVALVFLIPFYTWYGLRQGLRNDRLIAKLEADPDLTKTHHRKTHPQEKGWDEQVHVWPYLLRIEFLVAIIVTVILIVWSITLDAPLEEPANPTLTMNPSKAPWYFVGLQEMLVYFDPWIAGVVLPTLILIGLLVIPYIDVNPLGRGYYTIKQRRFAISMFGVGFGLWLFFIFVGTFVRGPGWMWFWPGETWDHARIEHTVNRDLHEIVGITSTAGRAAFGGVVLALYFGVGGLALDRLFGRLKPDVRKAMNWLQFATLNILLLTMLGLVLKIALRLLFNIKYVWVTPWFNV